jgi:hypothetical protein
MVNTISTIISDTVIDPFAAWERIILGGAVILAVIVFIVSIIGGIMDEAADRKKDGR